MDNPVTDLFVRPEYDHSCITVTFTPPSGCTWVKWRVLDGDEAVFHGNATVYSGAPVRFKAQVPNFKPWNVNTPYLYTLDLTLEVPGREFAIRQRFGMRKIEATADGLFLNNERFFVRGYIRGREAHDHPNLEGMPLKEYYAKNIRMAKAYGFNFVRFHSVIPPEECFQVADELGILIHIEMRKYYGKYQKERKSMEFEGDLLNETEWREMVLKLRNHPSLMVYCMGNEIDHPGKNPRCTHFYDLTKELDPTRLFIDTCSRGEFDRKAVDFDVQFMGYFYPFGKDYDMFENTLNWLVYGSCTDLPLVDQDCEERTAYRLTRTIPVPRPVVAHEICHYVALRDLEVLDGKFERAGVGKPWWLGELKKLVALKGLEKDYPLMYEASRHFQFIGWKLGIEGARRSRILSGFHFLQFSDTDRYENSNGLVDCFDDPQGIDQDRFLQFNGDTVLLADLPRRTFFEEEKVVVPIVLSHFSAEVKGMAEFSFELKSKVGSTVRIAGKLGKISLDECGRREVCRITLHLPTAEKPEALELTCRLTGMTGAKYIKNSYNLWLYPNRPEAIVPMAATVALDEVNLRSRYPQIESKGTPENPERLMIIDRFSDPVIRHLARGGDILMLYRVPETRDRRDRNAPREAYYLPATWDRFKTVIWDRGHNCGAFLRPSHAMDGFPHDGFLDMQFYELVDDCDKINLDDFPVAVEPLIQGVDKATRDRFDVYSYGLSELQPFYTLRKFAYLFEIRVGSGRLLLTGLNFTGLSRNVPETCALFESLLRYVVSDAFRPAAQISPEALEQYLLDKGKAPHIRERRMTQYWQLDEEPLESNKYWKESLEYIGEQVVVDDHVWQRRSKTQTEEEQRN
ncbi:MAG: glycoside hydrolase family 2 TIM barrel-domain containing protein [Candidatus Omnitrophota bacterium]